MPRSNLLAPNYVQVPQVCKLGDASSIHSVTVRVTACWGYPRMLCMQICDRDDPAALNVSEGRGDRGRTGGRVPSLSKPLSFMVLP